MATRFDPFQEFDRLFAQVLTAERASATMPMDLYRSGDHYVLHVDLPGADPGTIDVNVEDRTLTIRAQRTARAEQDVQWLAKERPVGTYARQLTVGRGLALDAISATYSDGVLTLSIPVAEDAKPRRIEVQHAGDAARITSGSDAGGLTGRGGGAAAARAPTGDEWHALCGRAEARAPAATRCARLRLRRARVRLVAGVPRSRVRVEGRSRREGPLVKLPSPRGPLSRAVTEVLSSPVDAARASASWRR